MEKNFIGGRNFHRWKKNVIDGKMFISYEMAKNGGSAH